MRMKFLILLVLILSFSPGSALAQPADAGRTDMVIVLGALHALHGREPAFDHDRLRRAILAFDPDIAVLEVRPDELSERKDTPGRPEYPAVLWPLLGISRMQAVAMEPGGEEFSAMATAASQAFARLRERDPDGAAALSALDDAVENSLLAYWARAGQSQDEVTRQSAEALRTMQVALVGPAFDEVQTRWDRYMVARAVETVRAHPGKRILILGSYRNRHLLEAAINDVAAERLGDAARFLDDEEPG